MKKLLTLLWLDDTRSPFGFIDNDPDKGSWLVFCPIEEDGYITHWVKSYDEFILWIKTNGLPTAICFDHDLGLPNQLKWRSKGKSKRESRRLAKDEEKTGMDCAKWLVEYCLDNSLPLPLWNIQSANPVGKNNIQSLLNNFAKTQ